MRWVCEESLAEIERQLSNAGIVWSTTSVMCLFREIRMLQAERQQLLAACEAVKEVSLEVMGYRSYSKVEQKAINLCIAAIDAVKVNEEQE